MPVVSKGLTQVLWGGAATGTVTSGGTQTSDACNLDATSFNALLSLKAAATSGTLDFYINYSTGDTDANPDSADEWDTQKQGAWLATLDCGANNPAQTTVPINPSAKSFKLYVVNSASGVSATVSAQLYETKA